MAQGARTPARQLALDLEHRSALGLDDFLVAPCNAAAIGWIDRWPDWPGPVLALYGPAGCGKSHLVQVWRAAAGAKIIAPGELDAAAVPRLVDLGGALVLEDGPDDLNEEALLHLINYQAEAGGSLMLTGRAAPAHWPVVLPDLRSRLGAAMAVAIEPPDDALLSGVLVKLFHDRQIKVQRDVVSYLVKRMERSFDRARRMVKVLDEAALAESRAVTVPLARKALENLGG